MRVMVTAHRPPKIGGYQTPNTTEQWVRANLRATLAGLLERHPDLTAVTGMALGGDQIFAEVCIELGIPFTAAVPFAAQPSRWPDATKALYHRLLKKAAKVVIVDEIASYHSDTFGGKMALRNKWGLDHSDLLVAIWDGTPGGTANTVKMARKRGRKILRIDPRAGSVGIEESEAEDDGFDVLEMFGAEEG